MYDETRSPAPQEALDNWARQAAAGDAEAALEIAAEALIAHRRAAAEPADSSSLGRPGD
ncbi:hypothetical protein [Motilibacter deserti]|uniref:Uncharacterized protein n=1 Tax=Motilibacter deserti TaxID=2714956 RepID=A0ABX0GYM1_9ACTN|nr:hypothetical protein [Motilibacter deserti]NHC16091.1 hypothetical protein [Motilibacter deserti]